MVSHILYPLIQAILGLILVVLLIYVVISWLYAFDIVSRRNPFLNSIYEFTRRLSDPLLRPLRRVIPPVAGVDLSVMILMLLILLLRDNVLPWVVNLIVAGGPVL